MLDSNENKSKGDKSFADWVKSNDVDFKKQLLPAITELDRFIEFVDARRILLKEKLESALKF